MIDEYQAFMTLHKVPGKAAVKCIDRSKMTVPEGILESVLETGSDVLVMGISGYGCAAAGAAVCV